MENGYARRRQSITGISADSSSVGPFVIYRKAIALEILTKITHLKRSYIPRSNWVNVWDPGSVLILGQVPQYGNPQLICIAQYGHGPLHITEMCLLFFLDEYERLFLVKEKLTQLHNYDDTELILQRSANSGLNFHKCYDNSFSIVEKVHTQF